MTAQMIPAYDASGCLVPVEKLDVHRRGLRHPAISVFVRAGEEILLQQRALHKYHTPGLWANSVCTHPHWGEDLHSCATRRLAEELGLSGLSLAPAGQITYRADVGQGLTEYEEVQIYLADAPRDLQVQPNPDEVAATRWITLEALMQSLQTDPQLYTPWLRIYLTEHAQDIFA